jgi:competence protein ComEC
MSAVHRLRFSLRTIAPIALACSLVLSFGSALPTRAAVGAKPLQIYFVDVEGGQSTLFVAPDGESLLIDTGWPGNESRDANRIAEVAKLGGVKKIDYVLITHFHDDHVGGVPQLVAKIPVGTFIDHGPNRETTDKATEHDWEAYQKVLADGHYAHVVAKPGDILPIRSLHIEALSADGNLIDHALPGAGQANPACKTSASKAADQTENGRSLGSLITFHKLRILDLGDLTWDKEMQLMCPVNKIGKIDIYIVSHHGWYQSSSPALLDGITPRVAIMDNGAKKGGSPSAWDIIHSAPGLEDLWQLHYSDEGGATHNVADGFIANPPGTDAGHYLKLTAAADGSFDVFNPRTKATKHYPAR